MFTISDESAQALINKFALPLNTSTGLTALKHLIYIGISKQQAQNIYEPYIERRAWSRENFESHWVAGQYWFENTSRRFHIGELTQADLVKFEMQITDKLKCEWVAWTEKFPLPKSKPKEDHDARVKKNVSESKNRNAKRISTPALKEKKRLLLRNARQMIGQEKATNHVSPSWATRIDTASQILKPRPWLIDGLIGEGGLSVIYGEPAAGKTFLASDMAYCVSQGLDWFGRKVNQGLVLYIAAERPQITKRRLIFYKSHYKPASLPIYVYENPFDLFNSDKDVNDLVAFVNEAQSKEASTFKLLIFDTLAKVMVGANENLTADMGKVIAALDRITANTLAHCMVIHHSGKDQTKGARGSNSLLGAIDTEIAVIKNKASRYLEVKKQREGEEGLRLGFDLKAMTIQDTSGETNTSCIVAPATLAKSTDLTPRVNKVEKAITSELEGTEGLCKTPLVKCIAERLGYKNLNQVYKKLASMVASGQVVEFDKEGALWVTMNQTSSVVS